MRERVELLARPRARAAMWVMTFHSACARMLRAEAPRLGYTRQFTIYDQADSRRLVKRVPRRARRRPQALHAGARSSTRSPTPRTSCATPRTTASSSARYFEQTVADVYELYERELHRMNAMDFDDLLVRAVNVLELFPEVRDALRRPPSATCSSTSTRTPTTRSTGCCSCSPASTATWRGRRRRPVDLRLPRRRHPQHPRLPGRLPGRAGRQARAELPLDADDPRRRQRGHRATTAGGWARRCGPTSARATRSRSASSTTSTPRRGSSSARSSGSSTRASSRAEIAVFYRTNAQSRVLEDTLVRARDRLPGHRRHEVLRARRDQGRDRLPDAARQPAGRRRVHARSPTRRGAGSGRRRCRACSRTRTRWASRSGTRPPSPGAVPGLGHRGAVKALRPLHGDDGRAARARRGAASPVGDLLEAVLRETGYLDALEAERTIEAQGRIENLEELVEVGARVRRRAPRRAPTRSTRSCSRSRSSPTPTRAATTRAS